MCQVLSPRSLQRRFSFNFEFHHNYLIGYLVGYLMFDVIITSFEIFELLLGCNMKDFHYFPRPFIAFSSYSSPFKWPAHVKTTHAHKIAHAHLHQPTRGYQTGKPLFSSSSCRNSTKNVKCENPGISGDKPCRFLNVSINFYAQSNSPNRLETL